MEFKAGDRIHVTRLNDQDVNFYATLKENKSINALFSLSDCSNTKYEEEEVWKIVTKDSCDYYTLATDEEDTEPVEVQHTKDDVNHPSHYNFGDIEVIDFAEQVASQYPPKLAPHVYNAIKYLSGATLKNGQEDIEKAKFSAQRLFDKWE